MSVSVALGIGASPGSALSVVLIAAVTDCSIGCHTQSQGENGLIPLFALVCRCSRRWIALEISTGIQQGLWVRLPVALMCWLRLTACRRTSLFRRQALFAIEICEVEIAEKLLFLYVVTFNSMFLIMY